MDIMHPPPEPSLQPSSTLFDGWFIVPFLDTYRITDVRSPRSSEIFRLYTLPPPVVQSLSLLHPSISRSICLHIFPFRTAATLASSIISDTIFPSCQSVHSSLVPISKCFTLRPAPTKSTWTAAYTTNSDTNMIINSLVSGVSLTSASIFLLNIAYRHGIANKLFQIVEAKLVYYEKTLTSTSCILRIVVLSSLRRDLSSSFHGSPAGGHMGEYKHYTALKSDSSGRT